MADPSTYQPVYVDVDDVPLEEPDPYGSEEKRRALFAAEPEFELDVNDGQQIKANNVTDYHRHAVILLAEYYLRDASEAPSSATLGQMTTSSSSAGDYAEGIYEDYERLVEKINSASTGSGGYGSNRSVAVNTRDSSGMKDDYPYEENDRFPNS